MSQIYKKDSTSPASDVETISGNTGGPVGPNAAFDIEFTASGGFAVTGNAGTNSLNMAPDGWTSGSVVFAGSSTGFAQDNTNFFFDNVNNRLGIRTNTPAFPFDVNSTGFSARFGTGSFANTAIAIRGNSGGAYFGLSTGGSSGQAIIQGGATKDIAFFVNNDTFASGSAAMTIFQDTKVAIGATAVGVPKLTVRNEGPTISSSGGTVTIQDDRAFATNVGGSLTFGGEVNAAASQTVYAGIDGVKENATENNVAGKLRLYTRDPSLGLLERMTILSSGNVGINQTSPSTTLEVSEDILVSGSTPTVDIQGSASAIFNAVGAITGFVEVTGQSNTATGTVAAARVNARTSRQAGFILGDEIGTDLWFMGRRYSGGIANNDFQITDGTGNQALRINTSEQILFGAGSTVRNKYDFILGGATIGNSKVNFSGAGSTLVVTQLATKVPQIQITNGESDVDNNPASTNLVTTSFTNTGGSEAFYGMTATRSTSSQIDAGTYTAVQSGDNLGKLVWTGDDGTDLRTAAADIRCLVDGAVSSNIVPGSISFRTTNTSGVITQAAIITASQAIGIGTTPNASAILDAQSTTRGVRFPNMTTAQRDAIGSPALGLVIYNTSTNKLNVYTGSWEAITSA